MFTDSERRAWLQRRGFRLPMDNCNRPGPRAADTDFQGTGSWPNPFNEFYKAAAWTGVSNAWYGFGRNTATARDANYLNSGALAVNDTTPVGFYDGTSHGGLFRTHTNRNAYGLFDMSGNVSEWLTDPGVSGSLKSRACYGGSWMFALPRIDRRFHVAPFFTDGFRGFRVSSTYGEGDRFLVRIPIHACVCGYGTGPGCEAAVPAPEEAPEEEPVEERREGMLEGYEKKPVEAERRLEVEYRTPEIQGLLPKYKEEEKIAPPVIPEAEESPVC
jgi:hypothetical protein